MKAKTRVNAGGNNHNQTVAGRFKVQSLISAADSQREAQSDHIEGCDDWRKSQGRGCSPSNERSQPDNDSGLNVKSAWLLATIRRW
jgi:hypothetical protein